jgi:hypothetical protein
MNDEAIVIQLLLQNSPIWVAFMLGFVPALIAGVKQRPKKRWYLSPSSPRLRRAATRLQSLTARRDRANPSSVRRMSTADAPGAVMHFCSDAIFIPALTPFGRCHAPSAFTLRAFERPGRVRR